MITIIIVPIVALIRLCIACLYEEEMRQEDIERGDRRPFVYVTEQPVAPPAYTPQQPLYPWLQTAFATDWQRQGIYAILWTCEYVIEQ